MPELDILQGFEYISLRMIRDWGSRRRGPFQGKSIIRHMTYKFFEVDTRYYSARLEIFPRTFALAAEEDRPSKSCTVTTSAPFDYVEHQEAVPPGYVPNVFDIQRSKASPLVARYLKPLHLGELLVKSRGKELIYAAGLVST